MDVVWLALPFVACIPRKVPPYNLFSYEGSNQVFKPSSLRCPQLRGQKLSAIGVWHFQPFPTFFRGWKADEGYQTLLYSHPVRRHTATRQLLARTQHCTHSINTYIAVHIKPSLKRVGLTTSQQKPQKKGGGYYRRDDIAERRTITRHGRRFFKDSAIRPLRLLRKSIWLRYPI